MVSGINTGYYNNYYNNGDIFNNKNQVPYIYDNENVLPFEQNILYGQTATNDNKDSNDGKISFGSKISNLLKGAAGFFTGMVCDENGDFSIGQCLKTVAVGAGIAAATLLIPGAGAAISLGFLGLGGIHLTKGIYNAATATTDAEAEEAWQNIGSSAVETGLAYFGTKKTGAFKKAQESYEAIKTGCSDLKNSYKIGGIDGLKSEVITQKNKIVDFGKDIKAQTEANWEKLADKNSHYNNVEKAYNEKIKNANPDKKAALTKELETYKQGFETVCKEKDFTKAYKALEGLKKEMNTAKEAAKKPEATEAQKAIYKEAKTRYEAAKTTFDIRKNAGEFSHKTADGKLNKAFEQKLNKKVQKAKAELETAKKEYDGTEIKGTNVKKAQKAYEQALAEQKANIETPNYKYRVRTAVLDGIRYPDTQFLALIGAGRGYNEVA